MLDNVLIAEIITLFKNGFATINSLVPIAPAVKQSFQPVQQGANSKPTIYLYKIGDDERMGYPYRESYWDKDANQEIYTELQQYASKFQASCWATQNPADINSLTASDYANYATYIMQSAATINALEAIGCGIFNISRVRNPPFSDDRQRFEFASSFDFVITHKQIITLTTPVITETVLQILEV